MRGFCAPLNRFPGFVDIGFIRARQSCDDGDFRIGITLGRVAHFDSNSSDSFQIIWRGGRESSFDNVHAHARQRARHFQLFSRGHRRARRLFAIA